MDGALVLKTEKMLARKQGAVGWMTFNQPEKHNAVSMEMWQGMAEIVAEFEADPEIRLIVLDGAGEKAFVAGADISEFGEQRNDPETQAKYDRTAGSAQAALMATAKPTLAKIKGYCIGGGLGIALACDLRVAADDSRFAVPAARLGLGYRIAGVKRLMDAVGPAFAKEIFFTARQFDAAEAWNMGLINKVVPRAELDAAIDQYIAQISDNAPLTIQAAKKTIEEWVKEEPERNLAAAQALVQACFESQDFVEGRTAFVEKRRPRFQGR